MALSIETEGLQKKKEELEGKLQSMMEEEKTLKEDIKTLEVSVAIQKPEEKIKVKREAVEELEFKKSDLEKELNEPETPKITEEQKPEGMEEEEQKTDLIVTVAPVEGEEPIQSQEQHKEEEKNKHRFF